MRILGLDVGDKKIGISLSDNTHTLAQTLKVYRRAALQEDLEEFRQIIAEHEVNEIVIGLPKDLSGDMGKRAHSVAYFANKIEHLTGLPVVLWDERFSTNEADRVFEMAGINRRKRKPYIDMMASQLILQGYLDAQKTR
ncbi:MAG: Holliday junction resolvase RuvX [Syntrophus sp. (in: bacteria)]|nr:Holliday junction resolvase RuvX [Syntrophus sp. (in: bacteria)]